MTTPLLHAPLLLASSDGPLGTPPDPIVPNSPGVELVFTLACAAVVLIGLVGLVLHWRRTGSPIGVLVLLGGMLACIQEPMVDTLGNMYIPPSHYTLFTTYGRQMPWFAPFGYGLYFGIPMFLYIRAAQRRAGRAYFQKLFVGSIVLELIFELIAVNGNFYAYYGDQPFRFFELPLHWMTLNMAAAWVAAAVVYKVLPHLRGWQLAAIPLITLCTITCSYEAQGWPIFGALHAHAPGAALPAVASLATTALGIGIIQAMIRVLNSPNAADPATATVAVAGAAEPDSVAAAIS
jgi:hypothetical protein